MNVESKSILVVDDHQIVREGVRSLLSASRPDWTIFEAANGTQAVESIRKNPADLVVMDVTMPDASGFEVTSRLREIGFENPILIFTMHQSGRLVADVKEAGAQGFVLKSQANEDLLRAIDILLSGGTFFGEKPEPEPSCGGPNPALRFLGRFALDFA
jgi:DNA-binding NarL/FixJ family response regulator